MLINLLLPSNIIHLPVNERGMSLLLLNEETRKVTRCSYTSPHTVLPFQHLRKYLQKPHEKSLLSASMINKD